MEFGKPSDLAEEGPTESVRLEVVDGNEVVVCRASREALEDLSGANAADAGDLLDIAGYHFSLLTDRWLQRIRFGPRENDGSVLLRSGDLT